jgi:hypothetical protein
LACIGIVGSFREIDGVSAVSEKEYIIAFSIHEDAIRAGALDLFDVLYLVLGSETVTNGTLGFLRCRGLARKDFRQHRKGFLRPDGSRIRRRSRRAET